MKAPAPMRFIRQRIIQINKQLMQRLAGDSAILTLSLLGAVTGAMTGFIIIAFRLAIEWPLTEFLPGNDPEFFEALSTTEHILLPMTGAFVIGLLFWLIPKMKGQSGIEQTGLAYVFMRFNKHYGLLPVRNAVMQFIGGVLSLITGQSSGREGPAVQLGATAGSWIGQYWQLPNNSTRILAGCGTAAAIAASFNTPIAGVIFAMEVILMEYTIAGFTPIIISAVVGTIVCHSAFGNDPAFTVPSTELNSLWELPILSLLGIATGVAAAAFILLAKQAQRLNHINIAIRFTLAGTITGLLAAISPHILGIGYDSVNLSLVGGLGLSTLLILVVVKLIATSISAGLGMPIGIIGPSLLIGACIGGLFAIGSRDGWPLIASNDSLYVLMGMGAMMGAVLNAPLAALMALLELTNNANIILPAMLTIVIATLTTKEVFGIESFHQTVLERQGNQHVITPMMRALSHIGVTRVMNHQVEFCLRSMPMAELQQIIAVAPRWVVVEDPKGNTLLSGPELEAAFCDEEFAAADTKIDVLALAVEQRPISSIGFQANLAEAWEVLRQNQAYAVYVKSTAGPFTPLFKGILTRSDIENHYTQG